MIRLMKHFQANFKKRPLKWIVRLSIIFACLMIGVGLSVILYAYMLGAPPLTNTQTTVYYDRESNVIGEEHGVENRYWVDLEDISPNIIQATLVTEDRRFYDHVGFDVKRILGAAWKDISSMSMAEGASTITQQYARNLYLSHEKTWKRKLKEALYTIRLEMFYTKDQLLEGYLNTIYYGHGAYGIEAASRYFFGKSAEDLSLAEASLLVGVPKGPTYYSPYHHYENAMTRKDQILTGLYEQDVITEEQLFLAKKEHLALFEEKDRSTKVFAPYFQDVVLKELQQVLGKNLEDIRSGGYQVYTTLQTDQQETLEETVVKTIDPQTELQTAALAMEPNTGAIKALVGGKDYEKSQFNRVTQAKRMPGSSFKPFLYYAALENGYTATTPLMSKPTNFELADGTVYQPSNYNGYYAGRSITLAQALALSDNVYAVKTNLFLKPETLVETAKQFGIKSELSPVPSLALGTETVSVHEMVSAYSKLANGGANITPHTITKVTDAKGNVIYERDTAKQEQVLDPKLSFILTHLMTGMFDESLNGYMRVTGATIADELTQQYAGKSGTTQTDSWMIGYSPSLVTGVWTGYDNNQAIEKMKEHQYAKDIWATFMEHSHEGKPLETYPVPEGIVGEYVDPSTGELATPYCENERLMYFVEGTAPTSYCSLHLPPDEEQKEHEHEEETEKEDKKKGFWDWLPFVGD
ncbi:penicillin-binding protein [Aquibacillus koreensis]|uniref:Penicillin-binding protein n=1 Tax=Aquibacillus koreensis TaxID=279446 RepID=A0A9X3WP41_9BACI|nr:transglycosylase domain-containing protein [Aquibacillus koreensis]MCT2538273.1 penicillin-binding protein [Aquibacillus koreensis]MDC3420784.1 penicillin-binding protein [Aquibacillus koreensis]